LTLKRITCKFRHGKASLIYFFPSLNSWVHVQFLPHGCIDLHLLVLFVPVINHLGTVSSELFVLRLRPNKKQMSDPGRIFVLWFILSSLVPNQNNLHDRFQLMVTVDDIDPCSRSGISLTFFSPYPISKLLNSYMD
jgi:hypothetical protein